MIIDIKDESDDDDDKTANGFVKMDPVIPSLGQNYSSIPYGRSNGKVEDEVEEQIETFTLELTKWEISVLMENNKEILEWMQRSSKVILTISIQETILTISGKPKSLENAKLRLKNFLKEVSSIKVSEDEAKAVIGRGGKHIKVLLEVSGAGIRLKDKKVVIVWGKEAAVRKAKRMLERILERNLTGREDVQWRKELEVEDQFSFVLSSKEVRLVLGVRGSNIEAIRDATNAIIQCKKYNGEEKLILEGSEDAKIKAKALIERILSKEVDMKLSFKQTMDIFQFLDKVTTSTGAIVNNVFKGSKGDFCGGLSIIGSERQVERAGEMVRDILVNM